MSTPSKRQVRRDRKGVTHDTTDLRNAERLVERHGADMRFVGTWAKYLVWDQTRWVLDDTGGALRCATDTTRGMVAEALEPVTEARRTLAEAEAMPDEEERTKHLLVARRRVASADRVFKWAVQSQNVTRLHAMLAVARSFSSVAVHHDRLDADPMLLNVQNGTIDLRTGVLREHRREDLITKLAPVTYDERAAAPTWERFMARAMADDAELVDFVQRLTGYALGGDVREHVLAFFFGPGANGKSTYLSTIHAMLGDYATPAPRGLLFRSRGERHPTELASLHGRRFVTCSEVEEGQAFDEALVKDLTGGDPIEARRMREDFWNYRPTHKLFLAGNHKPTVRGDDEGIWRRMRLVPWVVMIPEAERDPMLPVKLRAELPGILAWAVRGCIAWQAKGLEAPASVREATRAYRDENDVVGQFLRLHVVFESEGVVARKVLRQAYEAFCEENGAQSLAAKRFAGRLREGGVRETSVREGLRVVDGWKGVRLATDAERGAFARRDEGTCREHDGYRGDRARTYVEVNRESIPTPPDVPTGESETFSGYLNREGIGGVQ